MQKFFKAESTQNSKIKSTGSYYGGGTKILGGLQENQAVDLDAGRKSYF